MLETVFHSLAFSVCWDKQMLRGLQMHAINFCIFCPDHEFLSTSFCLGAGLKRLGVIDSCIIVYPKMESQVPLWSLCCIYFEHFRTHWWNFSCLCCRVACQAATRDIEAAPQERSYTYLCFLVRSFFWWFFSLLFGRWSLNEFHLASFVGIADSCLQPKAQDTRRHSQSCLVESIESIVASQAVTFRIKNQRFHAKFWFISGPLRPRVQRPWLLWFVRWKGWNVLLPSATMSLCWRYSYPQKLHKSERRHPQILSLLWDLVLETSMFDFQAWLSYSHNNCRTPSQSSKYQTSHWLQQDSVVSRPDQAWCSNTFTRTRADWNREQENEHVRKGLKRLEKVPTVTVHIYSCLHSCQYWFWFHQQLSWKWDTGSVADSCDRRS